jgi:hypothetical protein
VSSSLQPSVGQSSPEALSLGVLLGIAAAILLIVVLLIVLIVWRHKSKNSTELSADEMRAERDSGFSMTTSYIQTEFLTESNPVATGLWDEGQFADPRGGAVDPCNVLE